MLLVQCEASKNKKRWPNHSTVQFNREIKIEAKNKSKKHKYA